VTADALHTQRDHATFLVTEKGADYIFTAKDNQPGTMAAVESLFEQGRFPLATQRARPDRGHDRIEQRPIEVIDTFPEQVGFPHAAQARCIVREDFKLDGTARSCETVYGLNQRISAESKSCSPAGFGTRPVGHRERPALGPRRHVRRRPLPSPDRVRPRVMATLRNLAISVLRLAGASTSLRVALGSARPRPGRLPC
jgi:hypothetical protein